MTYGTLNNKVRANQLVLGATEDQLDTLATLTVLANDHRMITRLTRHADLLEVEMADPYSYYRGAYTWTVDVYIDEDGTVTGEMGDEVLRDAMAELFTVVSDDPFNLEYTR